MSEVVKAVLHAVRQTPFKVHEIRAIYEAILGRMVNKTCSQCGRVKPEIEGSMVWLDGDMSRPKRFICGSCSSSSR